MNTFTTIATPRIWPRKGNPQGESGLPAAPDFSRFTGLDRLFDVLLDGLSVYPTPQRAALSKGAVHPSLDIRKEEKQYLVSLEIPGVEEKDLRVEVSENELTISGEKHAESGSDAGEGKDAPSTYYRERSYGSFTRVLTLPEDVDAGAIAASYKNGVLTLSLPRREPEKPQVRSISIAKE
ncbi:MAG: Hsp20/alpha crystallin family protein [Desulfovibrio sp.]|jgi:HSP20 family protein|nr:Hsp20/alpha crystallin family protein [Desulfovibrio sp.]